MMPDFIEPSNTDLAQCPDSVQDYIADLEMGLNQCVKREKQYADRYWENRWRDEAVRWLSIDTAPELEPVLVYDENALPCINVCAFNPDNGLWLTIEETIYKPSHWAKLPSMPEEA